MAGFTMFGFEGLGRIKGKSKQGKERHCGCTVKLANVKTRGAHRKIVRTQPYISCQGSPMKRFIKKGQARDGTAGASSSLGLVVA
jgi:hypothetical protein